MSFPSVDEESLSSVYSSSSSFFGTVSRYSAAGNSPAVGIPAFSASSARRDTPKARPPATTRAPRVIPTIRPVLLRRGGGIPGHPGAPGAGAPHGWGAWGYP